MDVPLAATVDHVQPAAENVLFIKLSDKIVARSMLLMLLLLLLLLCCCGMWMLLLLLRDAAGVDLGWGKKNLC